jgi:hypothetical protein
MMHGWKYMQDNPVKRFGDPEDAVVIAQTLAIPAIVVVGLVAVVWMIERTGGF